MAVTNRKDQQTAVENLDAVADELGVFPKAYRTTFDGSGCSSS